jgi:hypothetical protein
MTEVPKVVKSSDDHKPKNWWIDDGHCAVITTGLGGSKKSGVSIGKVIAAWPFRDDNVLVQLLVEASVNGKALLRNFTMESGNVIMAKMTSPIRKKVQDILAKEPELDANGLFFFQEFIFSHTPSICLIFCIFVFQLD